MDHIKNDDKQREKEEIIRSLSFVKRKFIKNKIKLDFPNKKKKNTKKENFINFTNFSFLL